MSNPKITMMSKLYRIDFQQPRIEVSIQIDNFC
uniref:Uncharacterized protein n=1 Tax=Arundo donax TaxID=35708 RepID=A0A0A8YYW6_ARUDO